MPTLAPVASGDPIRFSCSDGNGTAWPYASVQVNIHGGGAATVYSDAAMTVAASNPLRAGPSGDVRFFVAPGSYDLVVTSQQGQQDTTTVTVTVAAPDRPALESELSGAYMGGPTSGVLASRPASPTLFQSYLATDVNGGTLYIALTAGTWTQVAAGVGSAGIGVGLLSARPTATGSKALYYATDSRNLYVDTGSGVWSGQVPDPGTVFYAVDYGVQANAKTYSTGGMTNGSAVFTDATAAPFAAADVGKVMVVNNAKGAGSHLWTTIASYQSASQVTLANSATATISGTPYSYGTDDTTNLQSAFTAACNASGKLVLPPTPTLITLALTGTGPVSIEGHYLDVYYGPTVASGNIIAALNAPTQAPYLGGSVIVQAGQNQDVFSITAVGVSVNVRNVGIYFAGWFLNTGHGFDIDTTTLSTYKQTGMLGFRWDNVAVYGHDGNHYGIRHVNAMYGEMSKLSFWGGGGITLEMNCQSTEAYGNSVYEEVYVIHACGPAHGIFMNQIAGQMFYLLVWNRIQVNGASPMGTMWNPWGSLIGHNSSSYAIHDSNHSSLVYATQVDIEFGETIGPTTQWHISPSSNITQTIPPNGTANSSFTWDPDGAPRGWWSPSAARRINLDGSVCLDNTESAGMSLWLMNDITSTNFGRWGISTDGTSTLSVPGIIAATGKTPSALAGAAAGTSPPNPACYGGDYCGSVIVGTGTAPTTGILATVTLSRTYAAAPAVNVFPLNAAAAALGVYVSATTTNSFTISCGTAPTGSQALGSGPLVGYEVLGGAAPPTLYVIDSFNRANNASVPGSPDLGPAPTVYSGTWGISSNQLYTPSGGGLIGWNAGVANCTVQGIVGSAWAIAVRIQDNSNFWKITYNNIQKTVAGSGSTVFNFQQGQVGTAFSNGDQMTVTLSGNNITVYRNGVLMGTVSDGAFNTQTNHGFFSPGAASTFDNLMIHA